MYMYMYISLSLSLYIYIYREREIYMYTCIHILSLIRKPRDERPGKAPFVGRGQLPDALRRLAIIIIIIIQT